MNNRTCPNCDSPIKGRPDKKYCSAECKTAAHYEKRKQNEKFYFQVDAQLKTNRKLLKQFNKTGKTTLRREVLHNLGFNPNYFTHFWKNDKKEVYFFCYDYGFLKIEEEGGTSPKLKYLIVQWQAYMQKK